MRDLKVRPAGLDALLADTAKWFDAPLPTRAADMHDDAGDPVADALRERIAALQPAPEALATWEGALLSNALWRLRQVIDVWQDCRALRALIAHESGVWRPRYRHWRLGGTERFFDRGMMLISCLVPVSAIVVACTLWISSGWHDGASAVSLAAVACCFFAALDEPAPMVFRFFLSTCASVMFAGLYLFVVLPHVHDFEMLIVIFAVPFILVGTLIPRPQFTMVTMLVAVNTATFISIQGAYEADFLVFVNSNLAGVAGLLFAFVWTRVTRPFGAELAAKRLLRSSWQDVALSASATPIADQRNFASRMLDRIMQLIPRLAASDEHRHPSIESFRDLRIALNALDLRRSRRKLASDMTEAIDRVLAGISAHYALCAQASERQSAPQTLRDTIDDALRRIAADTRSFIATPVAPGAQEPHASASQRWLRETRHALVGLRLSLFPHTGTQPPELSSEAHA
jgi:uncharacterized membrane protein YccC